MIISNDAMRLRQLLLSSKQKQQIKQGIGGATTCYGTSERPKMSAKGSVKIEAVYDDGSIEILHEDKNLVVEQAELIMPLMSIGSAAFGYIELGDPSPALEPAPGDINLQQTTGERKSIMPTTSGNTSTYEAIWLISEGNGYAFTEAGLYTNPLGSGTMFARKAFGAINKTASFSLKFTWAIVWSISAGSSGVSGVALIGGSTVTSRYIYTATGGETEVVIPYDFTVGANNNDIFLNSGRLYDVVSYYEANLTGGKGITLVGFSLNVGDTVYCVHRSLS